MLILWHVYFSDVWFISAATVENFYKGMLFDICWRRSVYFLNICFIRVFYRFNRNRALHFFSDNQHGFISFASETFNFLASKVVDLLHGVQRGMHSNVISPRSINVVFMKIGFVIQKDLAAQLVNCLSLFIYINQSLIYIYIYIMLRICIKK